MITYQLNGGVFRQVGLIAAGSVAGVIAIIYALAKVGVFTHQGKTGSPLPPPQVTAGQRSVEFWEKRFDKLEAALQTVNSALASNRGLVKEETKDIRDLLVDIDVNMKILANISAKTQL